MIMIDHPGLSEMAMGFFTRPVFMPRIHRRKPANTGKHFGRKNSKVYFSL